MTKTREAQLRALSTTVRWAGAGITDQDPPKAGARAAALGNATPTFFSHLLGAAVAVCFVSRETWADRTGAGALTTACPGRRASAPFFSMFMSFSWAGYSVFL